MIIIIIQSSNLKNSSTYSVIEYCLAMPSRQPKICHSDETHERLIAASAKARAIAEATSMEDQLALFKDASAAAAGKKKKRVMFGDVSTFYSNTDVNDAPVKKVRGIKPLTRKGCVAGQDQENVPACSPEASSSLRQAPTPAPKLQSEESWHTAQS